MSLQDLVTEKTRDDMLAEELAVATSEGLQTTSWQPGAVIRTLMVIMAAMYSIFSKIIIEPIKGGFGDLVTTIDWAKLFAKQTYDVDAVEAQPATGFASFTNSSASIYNQSAGDVIIAHEDTGKVYRNDNSITIPAMSTLTGVAITASEVGTGSNASPNKITVLVGPSMDGVTVTNPLSVLGANDETAAALIARAREKLAAVSPNGAKEAFDYIAKTPEFSATATPITRTRTVADPLTGLISVYLATATGAPSGPDVAIVQAAFEKWAEPWCCTATAIASTEVIKAVDYTVWVKSGLSETQIDDAIGDALAVFFSDTVLSPIGGIIIPPASTGTLYNNSISTAISKSKLNDVEIGVIRVVVSTPDDTALSLNEVPVLGTITSTVNFL